MGIDQPRVLLTHSRDLPIKHREVLDVLRDHCSSLGRGRLKQVCIGQPSEIIALRYGDSVDSATPQRFGYRQGVHLVEKELHSDRSRRSFSHMASS